MSLFFVLTSYLAAVASLVTGALLGLAILNSPVGSEPSPKDPPKLVKADPAKHITVEPRRSGQAFRYGPQVSHGRSDTPVNAARQALDQARAMTPSNKRKSLHQKRQKRQKQQEQIAPGPEVTMGFAPSVPSTGH